MTVINVFFADDAVHLLSDTLQYRGREAAGLTDRKVHVADNARFAYGCRGSCMLADSLGGLLDPREAIDEAIEAAGYFLMTLPDAVRERWLGEGFDCFIAGWSDNAGDLAAARWTREAGKEPVLHRFERGVYLTPTARNAPALPRTVSEAQFLRLAMAQWKIQSSLDDKLCIGGVQHLTTVTRAGASQQIVGLYPDHQQHAELFGDPIEDEVAAFLSERKAVAA